MIHKASRLELKVRNRGNTPSIVAAAAYVAGGRYRCNRTGKVKNYSRRRDVVSVEAVKMPLDPARVFNLADEAEKHPRARLAREFVISLPHELPLDVQRQIVRGYCLWMHDRFGMSSLAAIHHPQAEGVDREIEADLIALREGHPRSTKPRKDDRGNPLNTHVHILCPTRKWCPISERFGKKLRDLDDKIKGPEIVQQLRDEWQRRVNRQLEKHGVPARVDLRSYEKMAAAGDAPDGLTSQRKMGPKNNARGRRLELDFGSDNSFLGRDRATIRAQNDALWECWLTLRALKREKARLVEAERVASEREAARRAAAESAETAIDAAGTMAARAAAIAAAPHLDALSPMQAAIAWAKGDVICVPDASSDRFIDPETETACEPESNEPKRFELSKETRRRLQRQRQRQRQRTRASDG